MGPLAAWEPTRDPEAAAGRRGGRAGPERSQGTFSPPARAPRSLGVSDFRMPLFSSVNEKTVQSSGPLVCDDPTVNQPNLTLAIQRPAPGVALRREQGPAPAAALWAPVASRPADRRRSGLRVDDQVRRRYECDTTCLRTSVAGTMV